MTCTSIAIRRLALVVVLCLLIPTTWAFASPTEKGLEEAFASAAAEFRVPKPLIEALAWVESRWSDHGGQPSIENGYGVMHLADNPWNQSLAEAAAIIGLPVERVQSDTPSNIRGGAAVLASIQASLGKPLSENVEDWYQAVAAYCHSADPWVAKSFADEVYAVLERGVVANAPVKVRIMGLGPLFPDRGSYENVEALYVPGAPAYDAHWVPANPGNYTVGRDGTSIDMVVIHTVQGSYQSCIIEFQNHTDKSAHYVVRSSDGDITQMVHDSDTAYHALSYNSRSIGIEHEGYTSESGWYTTSLYISSAKITAYMSYCYGVPRDRSHIVGHSELYPGSPDPGSYWNWTYYMNKVNYWYQWYLDHD